MNYLAHFKLSRPDTHSVVGNMMGDFRRFTELSTLPQSILDGIENHQKVDKFTDNHPVVDELKSCFSKRRRRFASLILDVTFDHFLACHWNKFSNVELNQFARSTYEKLNEGRKFMPSRMCFVVDMMIEYNWLESYVHISSLEKTINRMSQRIRFKNELAGAIEEVETNYTRLNQGFLRFYPLLERHINL